MFSSCIKEVKTKEKTLTWTDIPWPEPAPEPDKNERRSQSKWISGFPLFTVQEEGSSCSPPPMLFISRGFHYSNTLSESSLLDYLLLMNLMELWNKVSKAAGWEGRRSSQATSPEPIFPSKSRKDYRRINESELSGKTIDSFFLFLFSSRWMKQ